MFACDSRIVVVLDWKDIYGNQRFRFGPGEKDVMWLAGPNRVKEKIPVGAKGILVFQDDRWVFQQLGLNREVKRYEKSSTKSRTAG